MSVRKRNRTDNRFTVLDKAEDIYNHTVQVMENEKIFGSKYQKLQDRIEHSAAMIYHCCRVANEECDARTKEGILERIRLQEKALEFCHLLKTDIKLAKRVYHLRASKTVFWASLVKDAQEYIKAWNQAEMKRAKDNHGL